MSQAVFVLEASLNSSDSGKLQQQQQQHQNQQPGPTMNDFNSSTQNQECSKAASPGNNLKSYIAIQKSYNF